MTTMRFLVANVVFTNRPGVVNRALDELIREWNPDALVLVETNRIRANDVHPNYKARQGRRYTGQANSAIMWRKPVSAVRARWILGTRPGPFRMMTRWINRVVLSYAGGPPIACDAMHLPPDRYATLNPGFLRRIEKRQRNTHRVWAGDMNGAEIPDLARRYGMGFRHAGVMFLATTQRIYGFKALRHKAFDHPVLIVDIDAP